MIYAFDEFELDDLRRTLRRGGEPVAIQAKVFGLLLHLIQHRGRGVSRPELLRAVWPDTVVSEAALSRAVKEARRAIGDDGDQQRWLRTQHGEGFEFVGSVAVAGEPAAPLAPAARLPFVGRVDTLAQLEASLVAALAGRGNLVLLAGEPGVGKTRTAEELAERARRLGALVLWGRCWEGDGAPALWPWLQLLRARARMLAGSAFRNEAGAGATDLVLLNPELDSVLGAPASAPGEGEALRFRIFDGVTGLLRNIARSEPLLVILDDLHCGDAASLRLARFVAREISDARILVLGTHRDQEWAGPSGQRDLLDALAREPGCRSLALGPLARAETRELAAQLASAPVSEAVSAVLHERTRGNPLFIGETFRYWLAENLVDSRKGSVQVFASERLPLARGVRELIELRLAVLGKACLRLLGAASVLGRRFPFDLLRGMPGLRSHDFCNTLEGALEATVLREYETDPGTLEFSHALVQECLYRGLSPSHRAELHREAGETIEKLAGDDVGPHLESLAHHFLEGAAHGDVRKAVSYARRAAERVAARGAFEEAAQILERALALGESDDEGAIRGHLLLALGEVHSRAGDFARARMALASAAEIAERDRSSALLARAALGLGTSGIGISDPLLLDEGQVRLLESAIAAQKRGDGTADPALHARLCARLALVRYWPSAEPSCVDLADEAVRIARASGDAMALNQALLAAYVTRVGPDRVQECPSIGLELTRAPTDGVSPESTFLARSVQLRERLATGERHAFVSEVAALEGETRALRQPQLRWWALVLASAAPLFEGRHADGLAWAREALALGERRGDQNAANTFDGHAFCVAIDRGTPEHAEAGFRRRAAERPDAKVFSCILTWIECETGRVAEARRSLARFAADGFSSIKRDYAWWTCLAYLAETAHRVGDCESAERLARLLMPFATRHVVFGFVSLYYNGPVARYLGLLAHTVGDLDLACRYFEAAEAGAEQLGARPTLARIQIDHAAVLLARNATGDVARAHALACHVGETASALGMPRLVERARSLCG